MEWRKQSTQVQVQGWGKLRGLGLKWVTHPAKWGRTTATTYLCLAYVRYSCHEAIDAFNSRNTKNTDLKKK